MKRYTVGVDIGTTAIKAVVYDPEGTVAHEVSAAHDLHSPHAGWAEEDANGWWSNCVELLRGLVTRYPGNRIAAIGVSGMVPTVVVVGADDRAVSPSIQQNDARAAAEIAALRAKIDEDRYFAQSANTINQQLVFPKLMWLAAHKPDQIARAAYICGSYDFIANRLTGERGVEANWALESGMWDPRERRWIEWVLECAGVDRGLLPQVQNPMEVRGTIPESVARETGIAVGTPVIAGCADHVASAFSTGVRSDGDLLLKLGGAGDILYATGAYKPDRRLFLDIHPAGGYLVNGCMATSGSLVKWFVQRFDLPDYETLTREAESLPPGSAGVVVLPYFLGEKSPLFDIDARGTVVGLTLNHTRAHLFRAILEAVAFGFRHHLAVLDEMGCPIERVWLSNGGSRSDLWKQIVVDVCGYDAYYVRNHPGSALGVAVLAAEAVGLDRQFSGLERYLAGAQRIAHHPAIHTLYEQHYRLYRDIYERLRSLYPDLARLTERTGAAYRQEQ